MFRILLVLSYCVNHANQNKFCFHTFLPTILFFFLNISETTLCLNFSKKISNIFLKSEVDAIFLTSLNCLRNMFGLLFGTWVTNSIFHVFGYVSFTRQVLFISVRGSAKNSADSFLRESGMSIGNAYNVKISTKLKYYKVFISRYHKKTLSQWCDLYSYVCAWSRVQYISLQLEFDSLN